MTFKESVEDVFGLDADERVPSFVNQLFDGININDLHPYSALFKECEKLSKEFLLYKDGTWVNGAFGWNLYINVYQLILPEEPIDWKVYLSRMSVMSLIIDAGEEREALIKSVDTEWFWLSQSYYVESGYKCLTREQMLDELSELLDKSKERYHRYRGDNPDYDKAMEENYPKFERILKFLNYNIGDCEVVRMNKPGDDVVVWYFVKAWDCFFIIYLSDCM